MYGVAVGCRYGTKNQGIILTTRDGANWSEQVIGNSCFKAAAWNGVEWMIISESGTLFTSTDGLSWSFHTLGQAANAPDLMALVWNGKEWLIGGINKNQDGKPNLAFWSGSGDQWAIYPVPEIARVFSLKLGFDGSQWVGVSGSDLKNNIITSSNSYKWAKAPINIEESIYDIQGVTAANGKHTWVGVGSSLVTSHDTRHWLSQKQDHTFRAVGWNGSQWMAAGEEIMTSPDGILWKSVSFDDKRNINSLVWDQTHVNWIAAGSKNNKAMVYTSDQSGKDWKEQDLKLAGSTSLASIAVK